MSRCPQLCSLEYTSEVGFVLSEKDNCSDSI
jgi:hypothetical protein